MKICHASSLIPDTVIIANIININKLASITVSTPQNQQHHTNMTENEYIPKKEASVI